MTDIEIIEDANDETIADWLHHHLQAALDSSDRQIAVTIPGGSTPFPILGLLKSRPLDWARIAVWPNDDREVPEDHAASNTGKIRALLEPAGADVNRLRSKNPVPHFALCWLGMGADGHIASLFPNTDPRADERSNIIRLTPDPLPPEAPFDRITLTIPALVNCGEMLFVIRGADKRAVFDVAVAGQNDLPIARLLAAARAAGVARVTCFT